MHPLKQSLIEKLSDRTSPLITDYDLGLLCHNLIKTKRRKKNIKSNITKIEFQDLIHDLHETGILSRFEQYVSVHKIFGKKINNEEEVVCTINPFAYISHLSAMEYHGLTDKIPRIIIYSTPEPKAWRKLAAQKMEKDFKGNINKELPKLTQIYIHKFGAKNIHEFNPFHTGAYINIKNSTLKVSSIGRTFLDMLRKPDLCDGIYNVIDAYEEHGERYLNLITDEIEAHGTKIDKVRAGYILEERCGIKDNPIVEKWKTHAQRGGSRKLDPQNAYAPEYSETWCLSINI